MKPEDWATILLRVVARLKPSLKYLPSMMSISKHLNYGFGIHAGLPHTRNTKSSVINPKKFNLGMRCVSLGRHIRKSSLVIHGLSISSLMLADTGDIYLWIAEYIQDERRIVEWKSDRIHIHQEALTSRFVALNDSSEIADAIEAYCDLARFLESFSSILEGGITKARGRLSLMEGHLREVQRIGASIVRT